MKHHEKKIESGQTDSPKKLQEESAGRDQSEEKRFRNPSADEESTAEAESGKEESGEQPERQEQPADNRSFGEKAEDLMDDVMGGLQDLVYGEPKGFTHDIPATVEMPSGIRKVNKVQTRRNIFRRLFGPQGHKRWLIILLVLFAIGLLVILFETLF